MASNEYHFITVWRLEATREEVYEILSKPVELMRWWPEVYLRVEELEPGDADGVGKVVKLHTKGKLPYTLDWSFRTTNASKPTGFGLEAWGDFVGTGQWTFEQEGKDVVITYDWKIRADKPLLKVFSFALKPVFSKNHLWAMARGEEGLHRELARYRSSPVAGNKN